MHSAREIGEFIKKLCKEKGISVNKMLQELGLNSGAVNSMLQGKMPAADTLATIARYLSVSSEYLLDNDNDDNIEINKSSRDEISAALMKIFLETGVFKPGVIPPPEFKENALALIRLFSSMVDSTKV